MKILFWEGGQRGISRRQLRLPIKGERESGVHESITEPYKGSAELYRDTNKIRHPPLPPPAVNNHQSLKYSQIMSRTFYIFLRAF